LVDFMMWLEALLSSLLLALALVLLLNSPVLSDPMSDAASYWELSDKTTALAELGADSGPTPLAGRALDDDSLRAEIFIEPTSFCYRWQWLSPSPQGQRADALSQLFFSDEACASAFNPSTKNLRVIERGVWRQGKLQFLRVEQAPRPNK